MSKRQRILTWTVGVCLVAFAVLAANPSFQQFSTKQFSVGGNQVRLLYDAGTTNFDIANLNGTYALGVSNLWAGPTAGIAKFVDAHGNIIGDFTDVLFTLGTNVSLTAAHMYGPSLLALNGSKVIISVPLTNVTSITVPMGAWFVNNVGDGASITNAVALSVTNSADGWSFLDAQTNAIRTRFALPIDWDGSSVKWALRVTCTAANTQPNTNVVFAVRGSMIGMGDREDSPTWSTLQWVTNGLSPTAYIQTLCITKSITPGGTVNPTNSILWEIQRLGGQTGDTATVATVALLEAQIYYSRTNQTAFPTSSP